MYARRFALIATRPEFLAHDRADRASQALSAEPPGELHLLDAAQVIGASELDRLCGYAVAVLSRPGVCTGPLLDALGVLDSDRICAMYFAVTSGRRRLLRKDPIWAYNVQQVESTMPEAVAAIAGLVADTPASELGYALARVDVGLGEHADG